MMYVTIRKVTSDNKVNKFNQVNKPANVYT